MICSQDHHLIHNIASPTISLFAALHISERSEPVGKPGKDQ